MKVKKRHLILIGSFVVLVLGLPVIVYIFKTPTDFGYAPNTWDLIFDFLDSWASAGAPAMTLLAVAVALGIGMASLLQTQRLQERERKERLLNEIINWAESIILMV